MEPTPSRLGLDDFVLRAVGADDCETVFDLRNAEHVRRGMYSREPLQLPGHRRWFERMLNDDAQDFTLMLARGTPTGVAGFYGLSNPHGRGEWTIYVGRTDAPPRSGTILALLALDRYFGVLGRRRLTAEVLADNAASLAMHRRVGFRTEGLLVEHSVVEGRPSDVVVMGMLDRDWPAAREIVQAGLFD